VTFILLMDALLKLKRWSIYKMLFHKTNTHTHARVISLIQGGIIIFYTLIQFAKIKLNNLSFTVR